MGNSFAEKLVQDICNYMDDLKAKQQLHLTIHMADRYLLPCWHRFLPYNLHDTAFCACIKNSSDAWDRCISCQGKVLDKAKSGPYVGICWAGVKEAVFPLVRTNGETVAFLSVSGYQDLQSEVRARILRAVKEFNLDEDALLKSYAGLSAETPDIAALSRSIAPLQHMITLLLEHYTSQSLNPDCTSGSLGRYRQALKYLERHFSGQITLQGLAEQFHCSYSSMSHLFCKYQPQGFSRILTDIRLDAAKKYLSYTSMSITGLKARCNLEIEELSRDKDSFTVTVKNGGRHMMRIVCPEGFSFENGDTEYELNSSESISLKGLRR